MESPSPTNQPTSGVEVLQVVLHKSYDTIKGIVEWLKENTQQYLIGEHPADEQISTTHCHILVEGLKVTRESLRKVVVKHSPGRGQNFTSALTEKERIPYERNFLGRYIIKGNVNHCKSTSFDDIQIALWASQWISYKSVLSTDQVVVTTVQKPTKKANTIFQDCEEIIARLPFTSRELMELEPTVEQRTNIVKEIISWANEKRKALHSIQVMNYYDNVLKAGVPDYYKDLCVNLINRRHAFKN